MATVKRFALIVALPVAIVVLALVSLYLGREQSSPDPVPSASRAEMGHEPYNYYLDHNPVEMVLSPQDAFTRALLGCQYTEDQINSSPIDQVLREAYGPTGICDA